MTDTSWGDFLVSETHTTYDLLARDTHHYVTFSRDGKEVGGLKSVYDLLRTAAIQIVDNDRQTVRLHRFNYFLECLPEPVAEPELVAKCLRATSSRRGGYEMAGFDPFQIRHERHPCRIGERNKKYNHGDCAAFTIV